MIQVSLSSFSPLFEWAVNCGWLVEEKSWGGEGEGKEGGLADFHEQVGGHICQLLVVRCHSLGK